MPAYWALDPFQCAGYLASLVLPKEGQGVPEPPFLQQLPVDNQREAETRGIPHLVPGFL